MRLSAAVARQTSGAAGIAVPSTYSWYFGSGRLVRVPKYCKCHDTAVEAAHEPHGTLARRYCRYIRINLAYLSPTEPLLNINTNNTNNTNITPHQQHHISMPGLFTVRPESSALHLPSWPSGIKITH